MLVTRLRLEDQVIIKVGDVEIVVKFLDKKGNRVGIGFEAEREKVVIVRDSAKKKVKDGE